MPINVTMSAVYRGEEEEGVCGCSLLVEQGVGHSGGYAGVLGTRVLEVADVFRPLLLCEHVNQLWGGGDHNHHYVTVTQAAATNTQLSPSAA